MGFYNQFDYYHEQAMAATGLQDFGLPHYVDQLKSILIEMDDRARYTEGGAQAIGQDIVGLLVGRLVKTDGQKQRQGLPQTAVKRPLIIIGLPRTGTTVLQRFLFQDEQFQVLPFWLATMPMVRPPRDTWEQYPAFQQVKAGLEQLDQVCPLFRKVHPMAADQPDECRLMLNQTFLSLTLALTNPLPDYLDWCLQADARPAYQYHREALELIGADDNRAWLLKDPTHLFALDALLATYPDACIIQTHRDPVAAIGSITNMGYMLRSIREQDVNPIEHGMHNLKAWAMALEKSEQVRRNHANTEQFFDIHIDETRNDPIGTVERMYQHFGIPISEQTRARWEQVVNSDPSMGHASHSYSPDFFGLSDGLVKEMAADYYQRLDSVEQAMRSR